MSSPLDPYIPLIAYLLVWAGIFVLALVLKAEKHGIIAKPYYLMLKTVHFNTWMEKLANKWPRGWRTFFNIGAAMGIGILVLALYVLARSLLLLVSRSPQASPTYLIVPIPGLAIRWDIFPYILIAIAAVLIPHELAHGIASVLDKVPLKSSGVFLAVVLPGGFVEIDEEDLAKRKSRTKLRVFAAGSFTNIVTAVLVLILLGSIFLPAPGLLVTSLTPGGPAEAAGITQWSVVTAVNGTPVNDRRDLELVLTRASPGDILPVRLDNGQTYDVVTQEARDDAGRAFMGIGSSPNFATRIPYLVLPTSVYLLNSLTWMLIILFGVGIVNMLPLVPFDGDRYFDTILKTLGLKNTKPARTVASLLSLALLGSNLVFSYAVFGTVFLR